MAKVISLLFCLALLASLAFVDAGKKKQKGHSYPVPQKVIILQAGPSATYPWVGHCPPKGKCKHFYKVGRPPFPSLLPPAPRLPYYAPAQYAPAQHAPAPYSAPVYTQPAPVYAHQSEPTYHQQSEPVYHQHSDPVYPQHSESDYPQHSEPVYPQHSEPVYPQHSEPVYPQHSEPVYPQHSEPVYPQHSEPVYPQQSEPAYSQQPEPAYSQQSEPAYSQQSEPAYSQQSEPVYPQPSEPVYPQQSEPVYPQQSEPVYPQQHELVYPQQSEPVHVHHSEPEYSPPTAVYSEPSVPIQSEPVPVYSQSGPVDSGEYPPPTSEEYSPFSENVIPTYSQSETVPDLPQADFAIQEVSAPEFSYGSGSSDFGSSESQSYADPTSVPVYSGPEPYAVAEIETVPIEGPGYYPTEPTGYSGPSSSEIQQEIAQYAEEPALENVQPIDNYQQQNTEFTDFFNDPIFQQDTYGELAPSQPAQPEYQEDIAYQPTDQADNYGERIRPREGRR